jgi:YidC/Oxa1 family membrane protein insertase
MNFGKEWKELKNFENLKLEDKSIVFYAENKASINHFRTLIDELTQIFKLKICYVTSVKDDPFMEESNENVTSFFIGEGITRTKFFLTLNCKVLIMDMPDLDNYHIKKSKITTIHYIYVFHSMFSVYTYLRKGALNNYDTIFCVGPHHIKEVYEMEIRDNLPKKNLIKYGFGRLDYLLKQKNELMTESPKENLIIIAPTYGPENMLGKCGVELIQSLLDNDFKVILRPHMRIIRDESKLIKKITEVFSNNSNFILETGILDVEVLSKSTCMITDWSGISMEYAFVFEKQVLYIDVPQKINNEDFSKLSILPLELIIREEIGKVFDISEIKEIPDYLKNIQKISDKKIKNLRESNVYNISKSSDIGAHYIWQLIYNNEHNH